MTIFVFMLSNYIRLSKTILLTSPILSQVIGFGLIIPLISTSTVLKIHHGDFHHVFTRATRMFLADLICRSHTPPILFSFGGLYLQIKHSPPSFIKKPLIDLLFANFTECPFQLNACSNKVATNVASDNPNISSPNDESPECLNKAMSCHTVRCPYMGSTTAQAYVHCAITFVYFSTFFYQK